MKLRLWAILLRFFAKRQRLKKRVFERLCFMKLAKKRRKSTKDWVSKKENKMPYKRKNRAI
jgi:hypothetical protein